MKLINYEDLPDEIKLLIPRKEILLIFGDKGAVVSEFTVKQYAIFLKYYTNWLKKYQESIDKILTDKIRMGLVDTTNLNLEEARMKVSLIDVLPEIISEIDVYKYFKSMFKELYPNIDEALLDAMTPNQLFYNIQKLFAENFLSNQNLPENLKQEIKKIKTTLGLI